MNRARWILLLLPLTVLVTGLSAGAATRTFTDSRNEDASAPDVVSVIVDGEDAAAFTVTIANMPQLADDVQLFIALDLDRDGATGDRDGIDVLLQMTRAAGAVLLRWDGSRFGPFTHDPVSANYTDGRLQTTLPVTALGAGPSFDFGVVAVRGIGAGQHTDAAPDAGRWTFALRAAVTARVRDATFSPAAPVAGRRFALRRARLMLSTGTTRVATSASCTATVAAKKLRRAARCAWIVPPAARGKTVKVRVVASAAGVRATRTFRFRIR